MALPPTFRCHPNGYSSPYRYPGISPFPVASCSRYAGSIVFVYIDLKPVIAPPGQETLSVTNILNATRMLTENRVPVKAGRGFPP